MASDEDRAAVFRREHFPGVEAHTEGRGVRPHLCERLGELIATVAPAELRVGDVAAGAVGEAKIVLTGVRHSVELVLWLVAREPVALVFGEKKLLQPREPVLAGDLAGCPGP